MMHELEQPTQIQNQSFGPPVAVKGVVLNALTGAPLPRVLVSIEGDATAGALTDGEGRFELPAVPSGPQAFSLLKPGFLDADQSTREEGDVVSGGEHNVLVTAEMPDLTFRLTPTAAIQGHIELSTEDPAEGITVQLLRRSIEDGRAHWVPAGNQKTDSQGYFRFSSLSEGSYALHTEPSIETNALSSLVQSSQNTAIERSGYPSLYYPEARDLPTAEKIHLQPGDQATANFYLPLTPFQMVLVNLALPKAALGVDNLRIERPTVLSSEGKELNYTAQYNAESKMAQAELPDGSYTLLASFQQSGNMRAFLQTGVLVKPIFGFASLPVVVSGHNVSGLRLPLQPMDPATIQLSVLHRNSEKQPSVPQQQPLATLMTTQAGEAPLGGINQYFASLTEKDSYVVNPLSPGDYWIALLPATTSLCEQSIEANGTNLARNPLHVSLNGAVAPIAVTLRDDCAKLTVSLPPIMTALLPGIEAAYTVWVVPEFDSSVNLAPITLRASTGGSFTLDGLTPGRYRVYTFDNPAPLEYRNPEALAALPQPGQEVTLEPNSAATLTVEAPSR